MNKRFTRVIGPVFAAFVSAFILIGPASAASNTVVVTKQAPASVGAPMVAVANHGGQKAKLCNPKDEQGNVQNLIKNPEFLNNLSNWTVFHDNNPGSLVYPSMEGVVVNGQPTASLHIENLGFYANAGAEQVVTNLNQLCEYAVGIKLSTNGVRANPDNSEASSAHPWCGNAALVSNTATPLPVVGYTTVSDCGTTVWTQQPPLVLCVPADTLKFRVETGAREGGAVGIVYADEPSLTRTGRVCVKSR